MAGMERNTAQTCANVGQALALGLCMRLTSRGLNECEEAGLDSLGKTIPCSRNLGQLGVGYGRQIGVGEGTWRGGHHRGHREMLALA
jgi:hypothetical protein